MSKAVKVWKVFLLLMNRSYGEIGTSNAGQAQSKHFTRKITNKAFD